MNNWAWLVEFNHIKTESVLVSRKTNSPPGHVLNQEIKEVDTHKHLGIVLSNDCTWHNHIDNIKGKTCTRINIMRRLKFKLDMKFLETIYIYFFQTANY